MLVLGKRLQIIAWDEQGLSAFLDRALLLAKRKGVEIVDGRGRKIMSMAPAFMRLCDALVLAERKRQTAVSIPIRAHARERGGTSGPPSAPPALPLPRHLGDMYARARVKYQGHDQRWCPQERSYGATTEVVAPAGLVCCVMTSTAAR